MALALRLIPFEIPDFEQLGLPAIVRGFAELPAGPGARDRPDRLGQVDDAGVDHRPRSTRTRPCHILTIEDPIEYVHRHKRSAVNQREVGTDTDCFPRALRSALREDPDVLLVGEMRDLETIQTALTIAETGHLVFATLHTNDAAQALDRIVDVFPAEQQAQIRVQLAGALTGVVYQRLLPRIGRRAGRRLRGAHRDHAVRNLVREGKTRQLRNVMATGSSEGMQTLEQSLTALVAAGSIEHEVASAASLFPHEVAGGS